MGFVGVLCLAIQKDLASKDEVLSLLDHAVAKGFRIFRKSLLDDVDLIKIGPVKLIFKAAICGLYFG
jgi:predicted nucleic acid-binding protein